MSTVIRSSEGGSYIPASQRPDGTWRKARRVKEGYVPQEEVPLYESKGKKWASSKPAYPIGLDPALIKAREEAITKTEEKKKKKKKPASQGTQAQGGTLVSSSTISSNKQQPTKSAQKKPNESIISVSKLQDLPAVAIDPKKKLKNLRKKLREIEQLEQRIKSGDLKNPDRDQLEKISRKNDIISDILSYELNLND